jgi:hypothetical protein
LFAFNVCNPEIDVIPVPSDVIELLFTINHCNQARLLICVGSAPWILLFGKATFTTCFTAALPVSVTPYQVSTSADTNQFVLFVHQLPLVQVNTAQSAAHSFAVTFKSIRSHIVHIDPSGFSSTIVSQSLSNPSHSSSAHGYVVDIESLQSVESNDTPEATQVTAVVPVNVVVPNPSLSPSK